MTKRADATATGLFVVVEVGQTIDYRQPGGLASALMREVAASPDEEVEKPEPRQPAEAA